MASVLFMRIGSVHHHTPNVLDECAKCFRTMQATIAKYSGMMARFNVDDKGTIMLAAFGPPPAQHEDDAVRAVRVRLRSSPTPTPTLTPTLTRCARCAAASTSSRSKSVRGMTYAWASPRVTSMRGRWATASGASAPSLALTLALALTLPADH